MSGDYYKTKKSVEKYIKLAEGVSGTQLIEKLKKYLPLHSNLLELGSGPGTDWKILNEYFNVTGSDNSVVFLEHLVKNNREAEFIELDAVTLETDKKFDGIYSNKVLHHLKDQEIESSIKRQHEILNPKGIICHSFWKGEGSEIFIGLFVNYFTTTDIESIFSDYFDILLLKCYKEFDKDDSILLIGKRK